MKRRNVQMAFMGEGSSPQRDVDMAAGGDDAVDIAVAEGKVQLVVPAEVLDDQVYDRPSLVSGELRLEDGAILSFEINDGATGATFSITRDHERADTHPGLSAIPNVPGGA